MLEDDDFAALLLDFAVDDEDFTALLLDFAVDDEDFVMADDEPPSLLLLDSRSSPE